MLECELVLAQLWECSPLPVPRSLRFSHHPQPPSPPLPATHISRKHCMSTLLFRGTRGECPSGPLTMVHPCHGFLKIQSAAAHVVRRCARRMTPPLAAHETRSRTWWRRRPSAAQRCTSSYNAETQAVECGASVGSCTGCRIKYMKEHVQMSQAVQQREVGI